VEDWISFLVEHGAAVLFLVVLAEQIGLPLPAVPFLLAAGALAGAGQLSLPLAIVVAVLASLIGDVVWYYLGLYRGRQALALLCRISLEPDSCVRRTEEFFVRHGMWSLVLAKFFPGLNTVMPALAGLFHVTLLRFALFNGLGALLWTTAFVAPGYAFGAQLIELGAYAAEIAAWLAVGLFGGGSAYIVYKLIHRWQFLRALRMARITAEELKQRMDAGQLVLIVDLRRRMDVDADPYAIPTALRLAADELEHRHHEIPRDQEVVLYCNCPNEVTAAEMTLRLRRKGISRVRPLAGGLNAWRELNYPVESLTSSEIAQTLETIVPVSM
jgi:membrane protein DedA with SNARE-associated domain/rhodanese-related sulfurtransferase